MILGPDGAPLAGDEDLLPDDAAPARRRLPGGLTLRAVAPNAITSAALCSGLTGIRFATDGQWEKAVFAVILAGLLDGIDGRVARLMKAQSRFGAELDSLADNVSFGVAPALILFMWSLQDVPRLGWLAALAYAIACALRLARFNARIDLPDEPRKVGGFLTGIPAPVGAGLAFLPMYLWFVAPHGFLGTECLETGSQCAENWSRNPIFVGFWLLAIGFLMISNLPTLSWGSLRPRRSVRLELIALAGLVIAALLTEPWWTLVAICAVYLATLPYGYWRYAKFKRQRAAAARA